MTTKGQPFEGTYLGCHFVIRRDKGGFRAFGEDDYEITPVLPSERDAYFSALAAIEQTDAEDPQFRYGGQWRELTGDPTLDNLNPDEPIPYMPTAQGWKAASEAGRPSQYVHSPHSHPSHTDTLLMNAISRLVEALEAIKEIKKHIEGEAYSRIVDAGDMIGVASVKAYVVRCICVADQLEKAQQAEDEKKIAYWTQIQKQIEKEAITGKK